jgi:hypothetical protein
MRTGLFAFTFAFAAGVGLSLPAEAGGPRHHHGVRPHHHGMTHQHHAHRRPRPLPVLGAPALAGYGGATVVNQFDSGPATRTININTVQTVAGIRNPPAAAPLLFIIPSTSGEARQAQRASAGVRRLGDSDTTMARIIVVR